jgi:acylglycerol lipase
MHHSASTLKVPDGTVLRTRRWTSESPARATVLIIHGYGEHSGRYAYVASQLMLRGYDVAAVDLRGHGESEGLPRGYVESLDLYLSDVQAFLKNARPMDGRSAFVLAQSAGGLLTALLGAREGLEGMTGAVLCSPLLRAPDSTNPILRHVAKFLDRVAPRLPVTKIDVHNLSHDPTVARRYLEDPLNLNMRVPVHVGLGFLAGMAKAQAAASGVKIPLLALHGTADQTADPQGTIDFVEEAASADKTLKLYNGLYHELLNEMERDSVIDTVCDWMDARV